MTRILGLDYGSKTIGVAISDQNFKLAFALEVITREDEQSIKKSIARLKDIIKQYNVFEVVLGFPKNMDNSEGIRCEKTKDFKSRLERNFKRLNIILWDERMTTILANKTLIENNVSRQKRKEVIDKIAAVYILQSYLDFKNKEK